MSDETEFQALITPAMQPKPSTLAYDLEEALNSVVSVRSTIPEDAFTATILGTERAGHGVLFEDTGLIVTIGYVIAEASEIWLVGENDQAIMGHVVGYDYESGFGIVQALGRFDLPTMALGDSDLIYPGDDVVVAGTGGISQALNAHLAARREFAGYWEYVLDDALFTTPPHPNWGGAALITPEGKLGGIGSLYVENVAAGVDAGNMVIPINTLKPILSEMLQYGTTLKPARPWLGMFVTETPDDLVVAGVIDGAPAEHADVRAGDIVVHVDGAKPQDLADFFRRIWSLGIAGCEVPLALVRDGKAVDVTVHSIDRRAYFKSPDLH